MKRWKVMEEKGRVCGDYGGLVVVNARSRSRGGSDSFLNPQNRGYVDKAVMALALSNAVCKASDRGLEDFDDRRKVR